MKSMHWPGALCNRMCSSLVPEHRRISIQELLCEDRYEPYTQNLNKNEMVQQVLFELNSPTQYVPSLPDSDDCTGPFLPSEKEQLQVLAVMKDIGDARRPDKSFFTTIRKLQKEVRSGQRTKLTQSKITPFMKFESLLNCRTQAKVHPTHVYTFFGTLFNYNAVASRNSLQIWRFDCT